jgi:peptidoglycan/xylan/chitin deacetylase (PgdA/CDA1 family)
MKIALTFDAEHAGQPHQSPDAPGEILAALAAASVQATFFLQGRWANAFPDLAHEIAADGHLIGNHSQNHAAMTGLNHQGRVREVKDAAYAIEQASGVDPKPWFRFPFGNKDPKIEAHVRRLGYQVVGWDFHVADWEPATTADDIGARIISGIREHGPVVLLHTWPRTTAEALPRVLDALGDHEFVTVAKLAEDVILP